MSRMSASGLLLVSESNGVATVTLNRPDRMNALSSELLRELGELVSELSARSVPARPRVLIITGSGERAFAAGADIAELSGLNVEAAESASRVGHDAGRALESAPFPSIARVNGFALGGGLELCMACDLIVCGEKARFGQPEINLGLIPGFGGTFRLTARVGIGQARRLIYTGQPIDAVEAARIGLVDAVFPDAELVGRTQALAEQIAMKAPLALASAKRVLLSNLHRDFAAAADAEVREFSELFATADAREGFDAFLSKRTAQFQGR